MMTATYPQQQEVCIVSESKEAQVSSYFLEVSNFGESVFPENHCKQASGTDGCISITGDLETSENLSDFQLGNFLIKIKMHV